MTYMERYEFWCNANLPQETVAELDAIKNDQEELKGRFGSDLQLGTAGMRGVLGAGMNRMNKYNLLLSYQGLPLSYRD